MSDSTYDATMVMKPWESPEFQKQIRELAAIRGAGHAAKILKATFPEDMLPFDDAYKIIFGRAPRDLKLGNLDFTLPELPNE